MLCADYADCAVTGVELMENAHETALLNAKQNGIADRLTSICADLKTIPSFLSPGSFQICVSNPPYFTAGFLSKTTPQARHEECCTLDALMENAAYGLKYGGDFYLVHKPERLAEIFACATQHKLEPKRLCLLRHRETSPVALVLVQCRKGGKPGLTWEEHALFDTEGNRTPFYRQVYHTEKENAKP
jgi:tRNA1Val (adenine37-N6)-methyltransferase